ncbi:MAG TPA: ABC transporter permease [Kiloniellales bacterium]|jgi:ABC-type nitrate/sulfonate/bicarbonate transport system permease component|nr:ABC transporter permease [Kiloniellales bacterium]
MAEALQELRFRGGGFAPGRKRWAALVFFVLLIGLWQMAGTRGWVSPLFLPSPAAIASALYAEAIQGNLWTHLVASLQRVALGWLVGTLAGLALGLAMGLFTLARSVGVPLVSAFFPIPKIALLPLFILWFGIGEASKLVTIGMGVFFPTVVAAYSGVDAVPRNLVRMAQSFGVPYYAIIWKIVLPGAMATIVAGFRITVSMALILVVAAEMIGAEYGLGAFIISAGHLMMTDRLLGGVVCLSILGLLAGVAITLLERRLLHWR